MAEDDAMVGDYARLQWRLEEMCRRSPADGARATDAASKALS